MISQSLYTSKRNKIHFQTLVLNLNLLCEVAHKNILLLILNYYSLSFFMQLLIFSIFILYCVFHMLFVLIPLTSTLSWYTGLKGVTDEDKKLPLLLFSFFGSNPQTVDNSGHDPCAYRASIVFVQ